MIDKVLQQDLAGGGDPLLVVAKDRDQIFVLFHLFSSGRSGTADCGRCDLQMLHDPSCRCNK
jgi:hypothetical protein